MLDRTYSASHDRVTVAGRDLLCPYAYILDTCCNDSYELLSCNNYLARNDYFTLSARTADVKSQQAREGKVPLTDHMTVPTLHHTIGSLMQVGLYATSIIEILPGRISTNYIRRSNAWRAMSISCYTSIAAGESERAREGGVAVTRQIPETTLHYTIGSLMQVGIYSVSTSIVYIPRGMISTNYSRMSDARWALTIQCRQRESPLWKRGVCVRVESLSQAA